MDFFDIITRLNDRHEWGGSPYLRNGKVLLPDSPAISLHSGWADMHFHFWDRAKYTLYINFYDIKGRRTTRVLSGDSTVEFTLMLTNRITNQLGGFRQYDILTSFFNISYLAGVDSVTEFMEGQFYCTLDIHLKEIFILELLQDFPEIMEPFVNDIRNKKSRLFFPFYMPTTLFMNDLAWSIFDLARHNGNLNIMDKDVEAMIVHAFTYAATVNKAKLDTARRQLMNEVYFYLMENPFKMPGIRDLCKIAGMNSTTLRRVFKETFHMTLHQCWVKLKLDKGLAMIKRDRERFLEDISEEIGFSCLANFSKAFSNEYSFPPSLLKNRIDFPDIFREPNF